MHLTFGYFALYTPVYRLMERKNISMYKTVHAKIGYVLRLLSDGKVGKKNIKYGECKHNRTR